MIKVETPGITCIGQIPSLSANTKNVQSTYQQNEVSYFTNRKAGELVDISHVIVLQYGSRNLRVGFAKDALPHTVPQVIAHRNATFKIESIKKDCISEDDLQERLSIRYRNARKKPPPNIYSSIVSYNKSVTPHAIPALNDAFGFEWTRTNDEKFIIGQAALRINPSEPYARRWPIRRGRFNTLQYNNYHEVVDDLDKIWSALMNQELKLPKKEFCNYGLVIVAPDVVSSCEVRALTDLALKVMGFKLVSFILESVSGSFGTGISSACVIDVGSQSSKVSLIEDGQILADSQTILPFGGEDLTNLFYQILKVNQFPFTKCDLDDPLHFELMDDLKVKLCTMDEDDLSSSVYEAYVRIPGQSTKVYPFKLFEERFLVPLSLFEDGSELLNKISLEYPRKRHFYLENQECWLMNYSFVTDADNESNLQLTEVSDGENKMITCRWVKCHKTLSTEDAFNHIKDHFESDACQWEGCREPVHSIVDHVAQHLNSEVHPQLAKSLNNTENIEAIKESNLSLLEAIIKAFNSIEAEKLKKFLTSILVMGHGHKFPHFVAFLDEKLRERYPGNDIEFVLGGGIGSVPTTKENLVLDSGMVGWKGGAVYAKLECVQDAWISQHDYDLGGVRALRERLMFIPLNHNG